MKPIRRHFDRRTSSLCAILCIQLIAAFLFARPALGSNQVLVNGDIKLTCAGSAGAASADSFVIKIDSISGSIAQTERSFLSNACSTTPPPCHPFANTVMSSGTWGSGGSTVGEFTWLSASPVSINLATSYHVGFHITNQSSVDFYLDSGTWAWTDSMLNAQQCAIIPRMRITGKTHGFATFTPTPTPTNTPTTTSVTPLDKLSQTHLDKPLSVITTNLHPALGRLNAPLSRAQQGSITTTKQALIAISIDSSKISQSVTNIKISVYEYHGNEMSLSGLIDPIPNAESILRRATPVYTQDIVPERSLQTIILRPTFLSPIDDTTWIISEVDTTVEIGPDRATSRMSRFYQAFQPALLRPILLPFVQAQLSPIQNNATVDMRHGPSTHFPKSARPRISSRSSLTAYVGE